MCKFDRIKPVPWPENIKFVDVRKGLPFSVSSVKAIFSSHMLEHMIFEDASFVIKECHRCLCKGGILRIVIPDLYQIAKRYVDRMISDPTGGHSHNFLRHLNMKGGARKGIRKLVYETFSHSKHLHMYDEWSLRELLEDHRFSMIEKMRFGQSRIPRLY